MKIKARCPNCDDLIETDVVNTRADEAKCPNCKRWFCYAPDSRSCEHKPDQMTAHNELNIMDIKEI